VNHVNNKKNLCVLIHHIDKVESSCHLDPTTCFKIRRAKIHTSAQTQKKSHIWPPKRKKFEDKCCKHLINSRIFCLVIPKVHNFFTPENSRKIYFWLFSLEIFAKIFKYTKKNNYTNTYARYITTNLIKWHKLMGFLFSCPQVVSCTQFSPAA
jgi:hypothetical protein